VQHVEQEKLDQAAKTLLCRTLHQQRFVQRTTA
jgi:hypothetical protein